MAEERSGQHFWIARDFDAESQFLMGKLTSAFLTLADFDPMEAAAGGA